MEPRKKLNLRDIIGIVKDKASISKAVLLSKPNTSHLQLAILRATNHEPSNPPDKKQVTVLLSYGHSSRNIASTCIAALMDRLHNTHNAFVAFKCLITIHYIINRGSFILQDQLSVFPSFGGRNYLNFSNFHDKSTSETLNLSFWVRWYARVLESLLFTSRNLGFFLYSSVEKDDERVSSLLNQDLLREFDVLVGLIEEICRAPELVNIEANRLVNEAMSFVEEDKCSAQKQIMIRVIELKGRIGLLSFSDSVELVCVLKRFENCKERLVRVFLNKENSIGDRLWGLVAELRYMVGQSKQYCDGRVERKIGVSESARFGDRVLKSNESLKFGSSRFTAILEFGDQMDLFCKRNSFSGVKTN
ncbi:hypothetical protein ACHQM5_023746 [Ranunculus cassubicifolius]